jgi:bacteriorhodopsin
MDLTEEMIINTFYITYVFLLTTGTITFIEAMRTKDVKIRNILNLETCISVIAAFFYGKFVKEIEDTKDKEIDYEKITRNRYTDWAITTPIMLLVLLLAFLYNSNGGPLKFSTYLKVLGLNFGMLGMGYSGMIGLINKTMANVIGFAFFASMYGYIYKTFLSKKYNFNSMLLFYCFLILWAMYGVFYQMEPIKQNVGYNILDLFSKCFVGIWFVCYFTKMFKL